MPGFNDIKMDEPLSMIFMGRGGTGKSVAAASYGFHGKTLHLDMDNKRRSIKTYYMNRISGREFDYNYEPFRGNYPALVQRLEALVGTKKGEFPYKFVFFDSLTSLARNLIELMIDSRGGTHRPAKPGEQASEFKALGKILKSQIPADSLMTEGFQGIAIPEIEEYLGESQGIIQVLDLLQKLKIKHGCHIGLIAHIVRSEIKGIGGKVIGTEIQLLTAGRKIAAELPTTWEEQYLFYLKADADTAKPSKHMWRTAGMEDMTAATCLPLPTEIDISNKIFFDEWHRILKEKGAF